MRVSLSLPDQIHVLTPGAVSPMTTRACAGFGIVVKHTEHNTLKPEHPNKQLLDQIRSSRVTLITGASGSGKSCMLRGIQSALTKHRVRIVDDSIPTNDNRSMIDLLVGSLESRVSTLSYAGLAEPKLWAMPITCLSVGERARLHLAMTMHQSEPGDVVIADEFATPLDRVSAYALARTMSRWAKNKRITLIAATAHEDMESLLASDLVIDMSTGSSRVPQNSQRQHIKIELGSINDYQQLAHLHYRAAKPATHTKVLKAVRTCPIIGEILAGVLVVSMPTLNSIWRDRAWPNIFTTANKSINAKRINEHLRCISRVIVDPRSRGLGVASDLVRSYLACPQTRATESIAAMGSVCPFFERAGMQLYRLPHTPTDLRLIDALNAHNQSLTDLISFPIEPNSLIQRELTTWAKARRLLGSGAHDFQTIQRLAPIAACRLLANPRAFAHVYSNGDDGDGSKNKD